MAEQEIKLKVKKSRHMHREIIKETPTEVVTRIAHRAYKGEKISDTVRKDRKYDPNQPTYAGNRAL